MCADELILNPTLDDINEVARLGDVGLPSGLDAEKKPFGSRSARRLAERPPSQCELTV
ncbi:MAG TPA: hypothetical protein VF221_11575 [Chloroflexota bacterium]